MTQPDIERRRNQEFLLEEAADRAVRKTFAILGVDIDHPESIEEFREDLRFGKRLRKLADHGMFSFIAVAAAALAGALWIGIVSRITGGD
jgi:hypothetical protein